MSNKGKTILGLSLGTRKVGFAVFRNGEFLNWGVKTYTGSWSDHKLKRIIEDIQKLVDAYQVTHLALKTPSLNNNSHSLKVLIRKIEKLAKDNSITIVKYSLNEMLKLDSGNKKVTKKSIMTLLTQRYSIFAAEIEKERKNLNPYYIKMFEAAIASVIFSNCFI